VTQASGAALFAWCSPGSPDRASRISSGSASSEAVPAMTASLGILSAPVIGVISTVIVLGERPTVPDIIGFVLIFAASACVVLPTRS
jgi:uncharacterized membrane protein